MKREITGWIPASENPEETFSWLIDDANAIVHHNEKHARAQWKDGVKQICISIDISEVCGPPAPPAPAPVQQHARKNVRRRVPRRNRDNGIPPKPI